MLCRMPTEPAKKASHTHTRTYTYMYIQIYVSCPLPPPFTTFWPSLIDCLTSGPANNLQFLLQSQSASCLFLSHLSPLYPSPLFTMLSFLFHFRIISVHLPLNSFYRHVSCVQNNCLHLKNFKLFLFCFSQKHFHISSSIEYFFLLH